MLECDNLAAYWGSSRGRCGEGNGIRLLEDVEVLLFMLSAVGVD